MNAVLSQGLITAASAVAAIAINALWQDALLVLGVWGLLRAWPHLNASTRYTVWSATLVAAVLVPIATTVPFLAAPPPPVSSNTGAVRESRTPILAPKTVAARHVEPSVALGAGGGVASETLPRVSPLRFPERFRLTLPLPVAIVIAAGWALLALVALFRLSIGIVKLEALKRDALPLPIEYRDAMERWTAANKGSRDVRLCVSDDTDVPVAVGLFDSMILIPRVLLEQLSETEIDQISLHELAHLRRADDWTNGLQRLLLALLAWNPAARFIGQQLDLEREVACDDWVLSLTGAVRPYALCLTKMAETSSWPRSPIPAPGVFATRKHISLRIERLLGVGRNVATNLAPAPTAAAVAIVGALALAIAIVSPSIAAPVAEAVAPAVPAAVPALATAPSPAASPQPPSSASTHVVHIDAIHYHRAAQTITVPEQNINIPARDIAIPSAPVPSAAIAAEAARTAQTAAAAQAAGAAATARSAQASAASASASAAAAASSAIAQAATANATSMAKSIATNLTKGFNPLNLAQNAQSCMSCSFSGVDWSGRDMHGVNYTGTDLSKAKLRGTNFTGARMSGIDFTRADLTGAIFRNANLVGVDFTGANLTGVDFTGAKLSGGDFSRATLTSSAARSIIASCVGCDFNHAVLAGMDLSNIKISSDDFSHADLRNVNFSGTEITGVDFSGALLSGANLNGTTLNGTDLGGVDLSHVDLSKAHLIGVDLSGNKTH